MAANLQSAVIEAIQENATANGLAVVISNSYDRCRTLETLSGTKADGERMKHCFEFLNIPSTQSLKGSDNATTSLCGRLS